MNIALPVPISEYEVPEGWQVQPLSKLCAEVIERIDPITMNGDLGGHYIGLEHMGQGSGRLEGVGSAAEVVSQKSRFQAGDILFGKLRPNLRKVARPDFGGVCSTDIIVLRAKSAADPAFLFQVLQSEPLVAHAVATAAGTKMPRTHARSILSFEIAVPPLDEQRRIAEVLRSVDEAIAAADGVISQLQETRSHRLETLMALPGTYRRIDEVCRLSGGNGFPIKHQGKAAGQYPFAKVSDMNRPGNEVQMRHAENYVDEADLRTLKAKTFPVGTTFFPKVGATLLTNKRRIAAVEMLVDNNVMGAVATEIDPWFLYYFFCTIDMADYVQPGAVPSVNQRTIGQIMIPVPDGAAQEEFVKTMRDLDAAIEMQSDALAQLTATKQALMSDLISGRVRVPA